MYFFLLPTVPRRLLLSFSYFCYFLLSSLSPSGVFSSRQSISFFCREFSGREIGRFSARILSVGLFCAEKVSFSRAKRDSPVIRAGKVSFFRLFFALWQFGAGFWVFFRSNCREELPGCYLHKLGSPPMDPNGVTTHKDNHLVCKNCRYFLFLRPHPRKGKNEKFIH